MKAMSVTISREYGSGGTAIAKRLAEVLGIPCYDKEVIAKAAEENNIQMWEFSMAENNPYSVHYTDFVYALSDNRELIFKSQSKAMEDLADKGPAVFLGRCGNYILRNRPDCIHVFICASYSTRIRRAMETYGLKEREAEREIRRVDRLRAAYYGSNTGQRWGSGETCDLVINTDEIGVEGAVKLIQSYIALRSDRATGPRYRSPHIAARRPSSREGRRAFCLLKRARPVSRSPAPPGSRSALRWPGPG